MDPVVRPYRAQDSEALVALWIACDLVQPHNDPRRDVDRKTARDPQNLLVLEDSGQLIGSVMVGYEGHRGWINYLAVHPDCRAEDSADSSWREPNLYFVISGVPK